MVKAEKSSYAKIYRLYLTDNFFFPLIAAVLLDEQDGTVYVDNATSPSQAFVEHAFGFSQIFGASVASFEQDLERYLILDKAFSPAKIRLYAPTSSKFLESSAYDSMRSYRQRFTISRDTFCGEHHPAAAENIVLRGVNADNIANIDEIFSVVSRFWRSPADFIQRANAAVVFCREEPVAICYAAAEANRCAEIDVLTLPEYRSKGLAKLAVSHFINRCFDLSLHPLWDCFTNNAGSMMLCKSVGFIPSANPYPFFTINK